IAPGNRSAEGMPAHHIRFRDVTFAYPAAPARAVLSGLDLEIPAGSSLAIVGQNGAGKTTLAKLLCRLYDPQSGAIEVDGVDLADLDLDSWRGRVAAVFQDFVRFELTLRENVVPRQAEGGSLGGVAGPGPAERGVAGPGAAERGVAGPGRAERGVGAAGAGGAGAGGGRGAGGGDGGRAGGA